MSDFEKEALRSLRTLQDSHEKLHSENKTLGTKVDESIIKINHANESIRDLKNQFHFLDEKHNSLRDRVTTTEGKHEFLKDNFDELKLSHKEQYDKLYPNIRKIATEQATTITKLSIQSLQIKAGAGFIFGIIGFISSISCGAIIYFLTREVVK